MDVMVTFDEEKQKKRVEELHEKEEEELAEMLSTKYGISYIDLSRFSINADALRLIPEEKARAAEVATYHKIGQKLFLAVRSPNKQAALDMVREFEDAGYQVELAMASRRSLERAWHMYKDISFAFESKAGAIDISGEEIESLLKNIHDLSSARTIIQNVLGMKKSVRTSQIVEVILAGAIAVASSDIHVEPEDDGVRLRYRIDGVLTDILTFDHDTYKLILSRIKLVSGLKLNVKDEAQDGRFSVSIGDSDTEVRTSILPDAYGESIVMRLLNPRSIKHNLEDLGIEERLLRALVQEIGKPHGMILTTGPTGSGKTTTLYAFLTRINKPEVKIVTLEDPVEYHLPGIVQTQVDEENYTFALGLRATLRQDPDVIMVGEIRDKEVAETAVHAALTGHLVFSTLHTNNAAGAFPRLVDLGVNPKIIGSSLNVVMAQRLVRCLCTVCRKEVILQGNEKDLIESILDGIVIKENIPTERNVHFEAVGCDKCNSTGYKGRIGIYEAIRIDESIEKLVPENPSEREINRVARSQGILSMREDGIVKVLRGITSLKELGRVVALEDSVNQEELDAQVAAYQKSTEPSKQHF